MVVLQLSLPIGSRWQSEAYKNPSSEWDARGQAMLVTYKHTCLCVTNNLRATVSQSHYIAFWWKNKIRPLDTVFFWKRSSGVCGNPAYLFPPNIIIWVRPTNTWMTFHKTVLSKSGYTMQASTCPKDLQLFSSETNACQKNGVILHCTTYSFTCTY